jgi:hypothetical protein
MVVLVVGCREGRVADSELEKVLQALDADFDAALARQEDAAASDLALSLLQDRELSDRLTAAPHFAELSNGVRLRVMAVGPNYVTVGRDDLVPLARAIYRRSEGGAPPRSSSTELLAMLRSWVRTGSVVEIEAQGRALAGHLVMAGRDHLALDTAAGRVMVPLQGIDRVRRVRGG